MRKLCRVALPFCAAIFAACYVLPAAVLLPAGGALAALGLAALGGRRLTAALTLLGLSAGLLWFFAYSAVFYAPAQRLDGKTTALTALVLDWPYETSVGGAGILVQLQLDGASGVNTLLYAGEEGLSLSPGDSISCTARCVLSDTVRGEQVRYYEAKGTFLRAFAQGELELTPAERPPIWAWPAYVSRIWKESIASLCPADTAGFLTALLTGDKTGVSDGEYTALQRSGAAHIVAVSGMHLSFLAGLFTFLFPARRPKTRAAVVIAVLFFFAAVTGNTPSVLRAAFMHALALLAPLLGREEDKPTTLVFILSLLLLSNPYSAASVSLQLSFGAVAGIHLTAEPLYEKLTSSLGRAGSRARRLARGIIRGAAANFSVTLGALLFTVPLTALHFGTVSLVSPITNLLLLWAASAAFSLGVIAAVLGLFLPVAGGVLFLPAAWLSRFILAVTDWLGGLAFASVTLDSLYLRLWLTVVYAILLFCVLQRGMRPILPVCAGICTLCAALLLTRWSAWSGELTVTVLDVGQGQSVLLASGGRSALIDCGGNDGNAGDIAADYLQSLGVSRLDLLILTHYHDDHANGVPELFSRLEISALAIPDVEGDSGYRAEILALAEQSGTPVTFVRENLALQLGESKLTLYAPLGDGDANEAGLFLLGACRGFEVLITGDANQVVEERLVKYGNLPDVELLVAGHHGSASSSGEALLDAITPEAAVISVGYNTYGHPAPETLARLVQREIDIYRTDLMGAVTIQVKGD